MLLLSYLVFFTVQSWIEFVPLGEKREKEIKFQTSLGVEVKSFEIQNVAMTAKSWMSENETQKDMDFLHLSTSIFLLLTVILNFN